MVFYETLTLICPLAFSVPLHWYRQPLERHSLFLRFFVRRWRSWSLLTKCLGISSKRSHVLFSGVQPYQRTFCWVLTSFWRSATPFSTAYFRSLSMFSSLCTGISAMLMISSFSTRGDAVAVSACIFDSARVILSIDTTLWIPCTSTVNVWNSILMTRLKPLIFGGSFLDKSMAPLWTSDALNVGGMSTKMRSSGWNTGQ